MNIHYIYPDSLGNPPLGWFSELTKPSLIVSKRPSSEEAFVTYHNPRKYTLIIAMEQDSLTAFNEAIKIRDKSFQELMQIRADTFEKAALKRRTSCKPL